MLTRQLDASLPRPRLPTDEKRPTSVAFRTGRRLVHTARRIGEARREARAYASAEPTRSQRSRIYALSRLFSDVCVLNGIRPRVSGPVPCGPVVLVANHVSYLDALVIAGIVPALPISKIELASWPLVGAVARRHGVAFVRRGSTESGAQALLLARRALNAGLSILNFPEGTTTRGESVLAFRRGVFGLARLLRVPVVPVAIRLDDPDTSWVGDDPFLPHYLRTLGRSETGLRLRFGFPMTVDRYGSAEDLAAEARAMVEHMIYDGY